MKEMAKSILSRLSCDQDLFNKELRKLILWMGNDVEEIEELKSWSRQYFPNVYFENDSAILPDKLSKAGAQD